MCYLGTLLETINSCEGVPRAYFGLKTGKCLNNQKTFDFGDDVWQQSSATLSRWRQSPRSPTAPSHLTPHLYWNLNDTICALPRRKVWIWHFEFTIWNLVRFGASPSEDQYWSVNDTIWDPWKAPPWREDNKAEIIRLLQLIQLPNPLNICSLNNKGKNKDPQIRSVFLNKDLSLKYIQCFGRTFPASTSSDFIFLRSGGCLKVR